MNRLHRKVVPVLLALGLTHCGEPLPEEAAPQSSISEESREEAALEADWNGTCPRARWVRDIREGPEPSSIANLTDVDGTLFFTADDGIHGVELWRSDGTASGTRLVRDIAPGLASSSPRELTEVKGKLFFAAGSELWVSDGTERGTRRLATFTPDDPFEGVPTGLYEFAGRLLFAGWSPEHGKELWISDGTPGGTRELYDLNPGTLSSGPGDFAELKGDLYFIAAVDAYYPTLWRLDRRLHLTKLGDFSDETSIDEMIAAGGRLIMIITEEGEEYLGSHTGEEGLEAFTPLLVGYPFPEHPANLTAFKGKAYFTAGTQLWRTDGTPAGTRLVKDVWPGSGDEGVEELTELRGRLYFSASDGRHGRELWVSDGTTSGTRMVADLLPGPSGSAPLHLTAVNNKLLFSADDGTHGREPWKLYPGEKPRMLDDLARGAASSLPHGFTVSGRDAFFVADDGVHGSELWRTPKSNDYCR